MKNFIEISNARNITGRRGIKAVIHEIHKDNTQYNKNGISWNEQYTLDNIDTVKGMPICVEFLNQDKSEPFGHGQTGIKDGRPLFEDSVMVGVFEEASIEELTIKGRKIKALVGKGYINEQRYPLFVRWLIAEMHDGRQPEGSVEICAKSDRETIIYDGGWKEKGRVPQIYDYTGYCILGVEPADDSAVVLELNKYHKKEESFMNDKLIAELNDKIEVKTNEINELQNILKEKDEKINELNQKLEGLRAQLKEEGDRVVELNNVIKSKDEEIEKVITELNEIKEVKQRLENEKLINELNEKLSVYSEEEQAVAKEKIEAFNKQPNKELLDEIIAEINNAIASKVLEQRQKNAKAETNVKADDIYADIYDSDANDVTEDDLY